MVHLLIFYKTETKIIFFSTDNSLPLCLCQPHVNTWPQPYFPFSTSLLVKRCNGWHVSSPCSLFHPGVSEVKSKVFCQTCRTGSAARAHSWRLTHYGFLLVSYTKCFSNGLFYVRCKIKWNVWGNTNHS